MQLQLVQIKFSAIWIYAETLKKLLLIFIVSVAGVLINCELASWGQWLFIRGVVFGPSKFNMFDFCGCR